MPEEVSKHARLLMVQKLRSNHTAAEIAETLGVSERTIKRDIAELRNGDNLTKRELVKQSGKAANPEYRDRVFDKTLDTVDEIQWAINRIKERLMKLEARFDELGMAAPEPEEKRGRGRPQPPPGMDGVLVSALFKGYDSLTNQLTLLAKLLGQITDAPQLAITQIDADVQTIIETLIENGDVGPARRLYNALVMKSERRARRMDEFSGIMDRILPAPAEEVGEFREEA